MHMSEVSGDSENAMVSIIVPVYNVEPYLRQCLDSLLSQSYRNLQIVCVNDGCSDGSPAILGGVCRPGLQKALWTRLISMSGMAANWKAR